MTEFSFLGEQFTKDFY